MDMTDNTRTQVNLGYAGRYDWGRLETRVYREHTEHEVNFLEDKAFWYMGNAPGMPMNTEGKNTGAVVKGDIVLSARDLVRVGGEYQQYRLDDWWPPSGTGGMSPGRATVRLRFIRPLPARPEHRLRQLRRERRAELRQG